jgi:hypothetical protein
VTRSIAGRESLSAPVLESNRVIVAGSGRVQGLAGECFSVVLRKPRLPPPRRRPVEDVVGDDDVLRQGVGGDLSQDKPFKRRWQRGEPLKLTPAVR